MKQFTRRILSCLLTAVMIVSMFPAVFPAVVSAADGEVYYLSATGSDSNDGLSQTSPFATMKKAMSALGSSDGTIKIIDSYTMGGSDFSSHTSCITIEGASEGAELVSASGAGIGFGGPVILKNITYTRGTNAYVVTYGHDITFGEGFATTSSNDWLVFGGAYSSSSVEDINVSVEAGTFTGKFNVGSIMPNSNGFTVKNDANVNITGGSITNIVLGTTNWGACGATTFEKSVVIKNDGGTIGKISATATGNGSPTAITGSLIVISNGVSAPTFDSTLDSISVGAKYYITSAVGGTVEPVLDSSGNAVEGKFKITIDNAEDSAIIVNGDTRTVLEESGEVTLSTGTTSISYGDAPIETGTTVPMTWKEMDKGYITFCYDDNRTDLPTYVDIIMREYNLPLCAAVPSNTLSRNNALLHEIQDRGGEILSHTKTHLVIKPYETSWAEVETQLGDSYRELTADGFNINGIILAGGTGQITVNDIDYRKEIELITNKYYKYSDKYGYSTQYWKQRNWFSGRTLDDLKAIVDTHIENKTWEVIYGHGLEECSEETIRGLLDYIMEKKEQGLVDVVTYKYVHENFGDWESPVDFGDTTYTVDFYGSDNKTYLGKSVVVKGGSASAPEGFEVAEGYTLTGWSEDITNITNNIRVYAVCEDSAGNKVSTEDENVVKVSRTYYIDSTNGSDSNSGIYPEAPFASVSAAAAAASGDDFIVNIIGTYTLPAKIDDHAGVMTVKGYNSESVLTTKNNSSNDLGGPVIIKDIIFTNGNYAYFYNDGDMLTLGENITTNGNHQVIRGSYVNNATTGSASEVYSGTWNKFILGSMASNSDHVFTKDVGVTVYGGTINNLAFSGDGWDSVNQKGSVYDANILVRIDGGTVKNITAYPNWPGTYNGAIQVIFNNGLTSSMASAIADAEVADGKYFVYSEAGGHVDFVYDENGQTVTGKFDITLPDRKYAIIKNGDETAYAYQNGEITLSEGTTNISYSDISELATIIKVTDGDNVYSYLPADTVNITNGGTISLPNGMEKEGMFFGGWFSDAEFTSAVTEGSTVEAGTIYAKWIPAAETDLRIDGIQIRITGEPGLRFVSSLSHATRQAMISLNSANASLDPADESFNSTDKVSYGTILLPAKYLGENELVKNGTYDSNGKTYGAKTVPARGTFEENSDHDRYTVVITGIRTSSYTNYYTARPYITYFDASGAEHTFYGDPYSASLYDIAQIIYEEDAANEPEEDREVILQYLYDNILTKADGVKTSFANTYRALNVDKKLTVGYLGGSITYGSSAAKLVNEDGTVSSTGGNILDSYVNRTTAWFEETYPDAQIEFVNAGISDTATNFGNYRVNDHLMNTNGHDMPDLVFVEFTSNDWIYDGCITQSHDDIERQVESLVRNIYAANPYADIVFIFTARGENSASRPDYIKVAQSYGIPYIDVGIPMQKLMTARGAANESSGTYYYTTDNLHPSAAGYGVYFEEIKKVLEAELAKEIYYPEKSDKTASMPEQLNRSLWLEPGFVPASDFVVTSGSASVFGGLSSSMYGTSKTASSSVEITPSSLRVTEEGTKASFTFTGTAFALIFGMNSSGVNIDYTINGRDVKNITIDDDLLSFQKYAHTQLFVLEQELAYDTYTVELTFNKTTDGNVNVSLGGAAVFGVDNHLDKLVALTIDDGPNVNSTGALLDVIEKYGAHATFFCVGSMVNANTTPLLQRIVDAGCEIGNHGYGFSGMASMTVDEVLEDFNKTQSIMYNAVGVYPTVFRAPGLSFSDTMYETIPLPAMGGYSSCSDWKPAEEVGLEPRVASIREHSVDGRIILIHDVAINAEALEITLPELAEKGFTVVTVSELYKLRGYNPPLHAKVQYKEFNK